MKRGKLEEAAPPDRTISEELVALSNNNSCPIMEGVEGGVQSEPGAGSSKRQSYVQGVHILFAGA